MRKSPLLVGFAVGGMLLAAPLAEAGTLSHSGSRINYTAASGETNRVTISKLSPGPAGITRVRVRDEGAQIILPGAPGFFGACNLVDQYEAVCHQREQIVEARVQLGDGDDYVKLETGFGQLFGGAGDDEIHGGNATFGDAIQGGTGDDVLNGGGGLGDQVAYNDRSVPVTVDLQAGTGGAAGESDTLSGFEIVLGGSGSDTLRGGDTAPAYDISGGNGNDTIEGGSARVVAWGGNGNDVLTGGAGTDQLEGGPGADVIGGSAGGDMANYYARQIGLDISLDGVANDGEPGEGDNVLPSIGHVLAGHKPDRVDASGASGPVFIEGQEKDDVLIGSAFNDRIEGDNGADTIDGGPGDDVLHGEHPLATRATGGDVIIGGDGVDTFESLDDDPARVGSSGSTITLDGVADDGFPGEGDNVGADVENVVGSKYADTITGSPAANVLSGLGGNDTIYGGDADDTLRGGDGDDTLDGQAGADTIECGAGLDVVVPDPLDSLSADCIGT